MSEAFLKVVGGSRLEGVVAVHGMKNAALPEIVVACLSEEPTVLRDVPTAMNDVQHLLAILQAAGADVQVSGTTVTARRGRFGSGEIPRERANSIRWSLLLIGAAAALRQPLWVPLPGGCSLGARPHDIHLDALRELGADLADSEDGVLVSPAPLRGADVWLRFPTVSGTINALIGAVFSEGETVIRGSAYEPEIGDVVRLLVEMGARITLADAGVWRVEGVPRLHGAEHQVIGDRFVAATFIAAAAVTGGSVEVLRCSPDRLPAELISWASAGIEIRGSEDTIRATAPRGGLRARSIETWPWPGFQSDLQPLHAAMMVTARGECTIVERCFSARFGYIDELRRMGADASFVQGNFRCPNGEPGQVAHLRGVRSLRGADLVANDIRGSVALLLAALGAEGESRISNVYQIQRAYVGLDETLRSLGAQVDLVQPGTALPV